MSKKQLDEKSDNHDCLRRILSSIRFLGHQEMTFRNDGDESDGNYNEILKLCGENDSHMICVFLFMLGKTGKDGWNFHSLHI